jgi:hypothetical protein
MGTWWINLFNLLAQAAGEKKHPKMPTFNGNIWDNHHKVAI